MAALHRRRRTARGAHVDVAAREVAASLIGDQLLLAAAGGQPARSGNAHPRMSPHGVYRAAGEDRWLALAIENDARWQAFVRVAGVPDDPRFRSEEGRRVHAEAVDALISEWALRQDATQAAAALQKSGIAAHVSWTTPELAADSHLRERRAIVPVSEPDGTVRAAVGVPMRLSKGQEIGIVRGTPALGEHEDYVFGEILQIGREERRRLEDEQVIY